MILFSAVSVWSQGKGVDKTGERVRDSGAKGSNSTKTDTGAGRGIDFGKGELRKCRQFPILTDCSARRDVILNAVTEVMRDRKLIVDEAASKPARE